MGLKDFFKESIRLLLWDGRGLPQPIPFLFAFVDFDENTGLKSQELVEFIENRMLFINN